MVLYRKRKANKLIVSRPLSNGSKFGIGRIITGIYALYIFKTILVNTAKAYV